jgi:hypothetical protein
VQRRVRVVMGVGSGRAGGAGGRSLGGS